MEKALGGPSCFLAAKQFLTHFHKYKIDFLYNHKLISSACFKINPSKKSLPVMVWIHGGAFRYGDSTENMYGPDYLLEKNVVFVSINYRLGAFGMCASAQKNLFSY